MIEGRSGALDMAVHFDPAPGFGAEPIEVSHGPWAITATTSSLRFDLACSTPLGQLRPGTARREVRVRVGEMVALHLRHRGSPGLGRDRQDGPGLSGRKTPSGGAPGP